MAKAQGIIAGLVLALVMAACGGGGTSNSAAPSGGGAQVPAGVQFDIKPVKPTPPAPGGPTIDTSTLPVPQMGAPTGYGTYTGEAPIVRDAGVATQGANRVASIVRIYNPSQSNERSQAMQAVFWHSSDGTQWTWIDIRSVIGTGPSAFSVYAVADGFVAVGEIQAAPAEYSISVGIVLHSNDGVTWTKVATLTRPYSVHPLNVQAVGSQLLMSGVEFICDSSGGDLHVAPHNQQTRYWRSADAGHTWTELPVETIGVIVNPAVPTAAACSFSASYGTPAPPLSIANGRVTIFAFDGSKLATSTDLATWHTAALPLPSASPSAAPRAPAGAPNAVATGLTSEGGATIAMTLTPRLDRNGEPRGAGYDVNAWSSTDGATFTHLPQGRPLDIDNDLPPGDSGTGPLFIRGTFQTTPTGVELDITDDPGGEPVVLAYQSRAGTLENWQQCDAAPNAECRFSDISGASLQGKDLHGVDLDHASLTKTDLSKADLTGANLNGTTAGTAKMDGAKLSKITARGANLNGIDLTATDLSNADLTGAYAGPSIGKATLTGAKLTHLFVSVPKGAFPGLTFAGLNLENAVFIGGGLTSSIAGADFHGADLTSVQFQTVDITGINLAGATLKSVSFSGVTCPDGKPTTPGEYGASAYRM